MNYKNKVNNNKYDDKYENKTQRFVEASKRERFHFLSFIEKYKLFQEKKDYSIYLTPEGGFDKYDGLIQKYEKDTYIATKRYIMEFKVRTLSRNQIRNNQDDGWILEKKKLNNMLDICNLDPDKNDIIYISFCNEYTIVWNITKMIKEDKIPKPIKKIMNKYTMGNRCEKVEKMVYLLDEEDGKIWNYGADEKSYMAHLDEKEELRKIRRRDTKNMGKTLTDLLTRK